MDFEHKAMNLTDKKKIAFIAMSKKSAYFQKHAVKFVLERGYTPISQYGILDYFLLDTINRDVIRNANNNLIRISDELWVFGPVSDGVLAEITIVKKQNKPVKYFAIENDKDVKEISKNEVEFEEGLEKHRELL